MKFYFLELFRNQIFLIIFFIPLILSRTDFLNAGDTYLEEMKIDSSTKFNEKNSEIPTNPFEIVEMIRRANSLNDATIPSDAIDDALKSFNKIDEKEKL